MNQPHKHAEVIKAWADGALVQFRPMASVTWCDIQEPCWETGYEYRIKPEPEYPKTSLDGNYLFMAYQDRDDTAENALVRVANAAIKQAIIDGDVIINTDKE